MPTYPIGVTKSLQTWQMNRNQVERVLDNATYDAAHPDDTLLLAGPARRDVALPGTTSPRTLMALGMFTTFALSSSAPVQPMMAIGSGRSFYVRGKSQSTWNIQRVMINGRNLLRALYHNAVEVNGLNPDKFDDPAAPAGQPRSQFFINLDSELFYIPFGMAIVMRTKSRTLVASCYLELSLINSYGLQIGAGQAMIMEAVSGLCDRVLPFNTTDIGSRFLVGRNVMDAVLGLAPNMFPRPTYDQPASVTDDGLGNPNVDSL
jgi:hypothetical protein